MRMTLTALPITSAGRFSPLGPVGMGNLRQQYAGDVRAPLNVTDDKG